MNSNQPGEYDVAIGGGFPPPLNGAVLGGIESVKRRLAGDSESQRLTALQDALKYGKEGLQLVVEVVKNESGAVQQAAYNLLWERASERTRQHLLKYKPLRSPTLTSLKKLSTKLNK